MPPTRKPNHKGKRRHFSTPEEIEQQMNEMNISGGGGNDHRNKDKLNKHDEEESDENSSSDSSDSDDEGEEKISKPKGVSGLIQIENPNRMRRKPGPSDEVQLSRREREEIEKQQAKERYQRLHAAGKTDQAKADLARLEIIRKQREELQRKREMEKKLKAPSTSQTSSTTANHQSQPQQRLTSAQKQSQVRAKKQDK